MSKAEWLVDDEDKNDYRNGHEFGKLKLQIYEMIRHQGSCSAGDIRRTIIDLPVEQHYKVVEAINILLAEGEVEQDDQWWAVTKYKVKTHSEGQSLNNDHSTDHCVLSKDRPYWIRPKKSAIDDEN